MITRPIPFSGEMVRALLDGRKTQTRRVVKPQPYLMPLHDDDGKAIGDYWTMYTDSPDEKKRSAWAKNEEPHWTHCPYGVVGDRLWVREAWHFRGTDMNRWGRTHRLQDGVVEYRDGTRRTIQTDWKNVEKWMTRANKWRPSIHMPRWVSRIELEITDVRVARLQAITHAGAVSEGVESDDYLEREEFAKACAPPDSLLPSPRSEFERLWDSLNAKRGYGWDVNPWVWVLSFKRVTP